MLNIKQLISLFNYEYLIKNKIIPDVNQYIKQNIIKYPEWIYNNNEYDNFDKIMNIMTKEIINNIIENKDINYDILDNNIIIKDYIDFEIIYNNLSQYIKIYNIIECKFNNQINYNDIFLINDILFKIKINDNIYNGIIEIKTIDDFTNISDEYFIRLFITCSILKFNNYDIKYIGIILPLQSEFLLFDIDNWDHKLILDLLDKNIILMKSVGSHIPKLSSFNQTLISYINDSKYNKTCQIFLRSNQTGKITNINNDDIIKTNEIIKKNNLKLFVHSPYFINLANPVTKINPNDTSWILNLLVSDLKLTNQLFGSGVVVHVGKYKSLSINLCLDNMEKYIKQMLIFATESCPLILETPAGQGTELCSNFDDFSNFYNRFSFDEKKKFKVCIDTCHVFASGYDPFDYLNQWISLHTPTSISLIHLNDSQKPKGSRVDRHAHIGLGYIGFNTLFNVIKLCNENNIPMVIE